LKRIVENYAELPRILRRPLWRFWHSWIIAREKRDVAMTCMNYGYAGLDTPETVDLLPEEENERYGLQMYHQAASWVRLEGKEILEVGSGRGGGAAYLARHQKPASYVGLDISEPAIRFCNDHHRFDNLRFVTGDAEALPFEDSRFDVVVNVESSRCYPHILRFFAEVKRVLKPEGAFLLTDMRWKTDVRQLRQQLVQSGFAIADEKEIQRNVIRALDVDDERKRRLIRRRIPKLLAGAFNEFAGVRGSGRYTSFFSGEMDYWSFKLVHAS